MADKKKVKSISSTEFKNNKEEIEVNNKVDGMKLLEDYESGKVKSHNTLKYVGAFLLGIIATIALFSILGVKTNVNKNNSSNTKTTTTSKSSVPYIGIMMIDLADDEALEYYDLDDIETSLKKGVVVESVITNTPAFGKLKKGDVIIEFNNVAIDNMTDLKSQLSKYSPGDKVIFFIERNGKARDITVVLGNK